MNHVMVDLETLGESEEAVILSISAVQFNIETGESINEFNAHININSCILQGMKIEASTVLWWLDEKRTQEARNKLISGNNLSQTLPSVLERFSLWLANINFTLPHKNSLKIWGRGPRFDFGILTKAYNLCYMPIPWSFKNELCVRTMEFLVPEIKAGTLPKGTAHSGIDDCKYQIEYVSKIYNHLCNVDNKWRNIMNEMFEENIKENSYCQPNSETK